MSVAIGLGANDYHVDFFFSHEVEFNAESVSAIAPIKWTSPTLDRVLGNLGITPDRYTVLNVNNTWIEDYSYVETIIANEEDLIMIKLAFEQVGRTREDVIDKLRELNLKQEITT